MTTKQRAPELPEALDWVNTQDAPHLSQLRGRVVLLHFWTHSNINCQHVINDLRYFENKYHDGITVLGLHCPKFTAERSSSSVLKAVNRFYVRHAVANDLEFRAWQTFSIKAWPSVVVIDTEGYLSTVVQGEGQRNELDAVITRLLDEGAQRDLRSYESASAVVRAEPKLPLRFPSRVLATEQLLYVADSGHNRILEVTHDGRILRQFGSGNPGYWDGRGTDAGFSNPSGMALIKDILYVADTDNHAIRRIRLHNADIDTVSGTGQIGYDELEINAPYASLALNSPIDLVANQDRLFVALAGRNQVMELDLGQGRVNSLLGSGRHDWVDGTIDNMCLARPSGLALQAQTLFIADADSSSIRLVRFVDHQSKSMVGQGLYQFGDVDGGAEKAQLQYPNALALDSGGSILWIADTFNNKIKALSLRGGGVRSLALNYRFHEPTGISVAAKAIWIANTNAHEIVRIDAGSGQIRHLPIGE
jgi:sugar lactone lactonase YvrE